MKFSGLPIGDWFFFDGYLGAIGKSIVGKKTGKNSTGCNAVTQSGIEIYMSTDREVSPLNRDMFLNIEEKSHDIDTRIQSLEWRQDNVSEFLFSDNSIFVETEARLEKIEDVLKSISGFLAMEYPTPPSFL